MKKIRGAESAMNQESLGRAAVLVTPVEESGWAISAILGANSGLRSLASYSLFHVVPNFSASIGFPCRTLLSLLLFPGLLPGPAFRMSRPLPPPAASEGVSSLREIQQTKNKIAFTLLV